MRRQPNTHFTGRGRAVQLTFRRPRCRASEFFRSAAWLHGSVEAEVPILKGSDHSIVYFAFVLPPGWLRFSLTGSFA